MRLAIVTACLSVLGMAAACSVEEPPPQSEPRDADTATASFALTAQCAQCAATATQNVCGPQAQACLQDPSCANASACVQACPPADPMCIAACYQQAAQVLDDLADCVVCQECPNECAGLWPCNGGGGSGGMGGAGGSSGGMGGAGGQSPSSGVCDNTGICEACLACSIAGPCAAQIQQCLQDPTCIADPMNAQSVIECAVCTECANDCAGALPNIPNAPSCPP